MTKKKLKQFRFWFRFRYALSFGFGFGIGSDPTEISVFRFRFKLRFRSITKCDTSNFLMSPEEAQVWQVLKSWKWVLHVLQVFTNVYKLGHFTCKSTFYRYMEWFSLPLPNFANMPQSLVLPKYSVSRLIWSRLMLSFGWCDQFF